MSPVLKQRLIGAAVLIALAVIFLPMLVKGPAPDSGVSDLSLRVADGPRGEYKTVDLPLVAPAGTRDGSVLDAPAPPQDHLPMVDTATAGEESEPMPDSDAGVATLPAPRAAATAVTAMPPATTAAGNYVVHFGAFATSANADAILRQIRDAAQLDGYSEAATVNGNPAFRVRIGPYATRAEAEAVRLRAARVRDDVKPRVVVLDAQPTANTVATRAPPPATSAPAATPSVATPPAVTPPAVTPPASTAATTTPTTVAAPVAATDVGFVVQVTALRNAAEATALRDRLRGQGIVAFIDTVETDNGRLSRVKAGPVASRAEADGLKSRVKSAVGIDGFVRQHP